MNFRPGWTAGSRSPVTPRQAGPRVASTEVWYEQDFSI